MAKSVDINFIYQDTKVVYLKSGKAYCIGFDVGTRSMKGFGTEDPLVAEQLAKYFKHMAKQLRENQRSSLVVALTGTSTKKGKKSENKSKDRSRA